MTAIVVPCILVGGSLYVWFHHRQNVPHFHGHITAGDVQHLEQKIGKGTWDASAGTINPLKVTDGMQFRLTATTDKHITPGQTYTLNIKTLLYKGEKFPILFELEPGGHQNGALLTDNVLSAVGWTQFWEADGAPKSMVNQALQEAPTYTFVCIAGPQKGQTMVVSNFLAWNAYLHKLGGPAIPVENRT